jgi:hypothetical protein
LVVGGLSATGTAEVGVVVGASVGGVVAGAVTEVVGGVVGGAAGSPPNGQNTTTTATSNSVPTKPAMALAT